MFVDGKHETFSDFYHGESLFADKDGFYEPIYDGIDTLMIYTLSPGVTSSFKDIQICMDICPGTDKDKLLSAAMGRYKRAALWIKWFGENQRIGPQYPELA